jgi:hypothetical protein
MIAAVFVTMELLKWQCKFASKKSSSGFNETIVMGQLLGVAVEARAK